MTGLVNLMEKMYLVEAEVNCLLAEIPVERNSHLKDQYQPTVFQDEKEGNCSAIIMFLIYNYF